MATPNLTSVTPVSPAAAKPEFDTETPIDTKVTAFTKADLEKWGDWLLYRLSPLYPHMTPLNYIGLIGQYMGSNHVLFIKTEFAIGLAVVLRDTLDPRPVVRNVFVFKHHPDRKEEDRDVRLILRAYRDWGCSHGAKAVEMTGYFGDLTPSVQAEMTGKRSYQVRFLELDK